MRLKRNWHLFQRNVYFYFQKKENFTAFFFWTECNLLVFNQANVHAKLVGLFHRFWNRPYMRHNVIKQVHTFTSTILFEQRHFGLGCPSFIKSNLRHNVFAPTFHPNNKYSCELENAQKNENHFNLQLTDFQRLPLSFLSSVNIWCYSRRDKICPPFLIFSWLYIIAWLVQHWTAFSALKCMIELPETKIGRIGAR